MIYGLRMLETDNNCIFENIVSFLFRGERYAEILGITNSHPFTIVKP
jgi:hypothetical protein